MKLTALLVENWDKISQKLNKWTGKNLKENPAIRLL
jgi:hypothetical protein